MQIVHIYRKLDKLHRYFFIKIKKITASYTDDLIYKKDKTKVTSFL